MMTCIIVEDQPPAQRVLKHYIEREGSLELLGVFSDVKRANEFLKKRLVDLIFLDVQLPRISGIDFLKQLPFQAKVIVTTAFSNYALEGYELNITDYLLKPFAYSRFKIAVDKAARDTQKIQRYKNEVFIKSGHALLRIIVSDITHITSNSDYTEIHEGYHKHLSSESLKYWNEYLNPRRFIRIHKSYIINIGHIKKISGNKVLLEGGIQLPLGRAYKNDFISSLS